LSQIKFTLENWEKCKCVKCPVQAENQCFQEKNVKTNVISSISELMDHITIEMYTRQTLVSLFRCLLESIIESKSDAVVLLKINKIKYFQGLINRLSYSGAKVYDYANSLDYNFNKVSLNNPDLENDEFLIIIGERISMTLFWDESTSEVFGLCQGFCSLNPCDSTKIIEYLQSIAWSGSLDKDLSLIKADRRNNEKFTFILRKLVASLESRQRDLICANTELREMHEKTLQTEKLAAIGQLCSTIAHELRNPLGMIDLYAKIIQKNVEKITIDTIDSKITDDLTTACDSIAKVSKSLDILLTELIDYSKPMAIEKKDMNLKEVVEDVVNLLSPFLKEKGVGLAVNYVLDNGIKVKFDKIRLNQALLNVIKNAFEVSGTGDTIEIQIGCRADDNEVFIKIKDQGQGISTQDKEKIFTPYFTTKKDGTGLGLAQARKIMEAHGGSLYIVSTNPKGTIFGMKLPAERARI